MTMLDRLLKDIEKAEELTLHKFARAKDFVKEGKLFKAQDRLRGAVSWTQSAQDEVILAIRESVEGIEG